MLININTDIKNDYCSNSNASGKCCTLPLETTTLIQRSSYQHTVLGNLSKILSVEHTMESILKFYLFLPIARTMTDCCLLFLYLKRFHPDERICLKLILTANNKTIFSGIPLKSSFYQIQNSIFFEIKFSPQTNPISPHPVEIQFSPNTKPVFFDNFAVIWGTFYKDFIVFPVFLDA